MRIPQVQPGDRQISASLVNAVARELVRLGALTVEGLTLSSDAAGTQVSLPQQEPLLYAELTDLSVTGAYSWREVRPKDTGVATWETVTGGRDGTATSHPAYLWHGVPTAPVGAMVRMRRGYAFIVSSALSQEWLIEYDDDAIVKITSTTPTAGRYPAKLQRYTLASNTCSNLIDVLAVDLNNRVPGLVYYLGRYMGGSVTGKPVFAIRCPIFDCIDNIASGI